MYNAKILLSRLVDLVSKDIFFGHGYLYDKETQLKKNKNDSITEKTLKFYCTLRKIIKWFGTQLHNRTKFLSKCTQTLFFSLV